MDFKTLIQRLKELAAKDLNLFFKELNKYFRSDSDNLNTKIALQARHKNLKKQGMKGEISDAYKNTTYLRILSEALDFCDFIMPEDVNLNISNRGSDSPTSELENDFKTLERNWRVRDLINDNTIIIIVSIHIYAEITDRYTANLLKKVIDERGKFKHGKRALIISDLYYYYDKNDENELKNNSVISIGGDAINDVTLHIEQNLDDFIADKNTRIVFNNEDKRIMVALAGISATDTKEVVNKFINLKEKGLDYFLNTVWS